MMGNEGMPKSLATPLKSATLMSCSSPPTTDTGTIGVPVSSARRMKPRPKSTS